MERFTISLERDLAEAFDRLMQARGYTNRSEAVRDMLRGAVERHRQANETGTHCVASLSYVYNHHERELAERLTSLQHEHHDLCVSTTHAHLDHEHCLETVLLRGPAAAVRRFADALIAERGVRHGQLNLITVEVADSGKAVRYAHAQAGPRAHEHSHDGAAASSHPHLHLKPRS